MLILGIAKEHTKPMKKFLSNLQIMSKPHTLLKLPGESTTVQSLQLSTEPFRFPSSQTSQSKLTFSQN